jgi:hypothetical protein
MRESGTTPLQVLLNWRIAGRYQAVNIYSKFLATRDTATPP